MQGLEGLDTAQNGLYGVLCVGRGLAEAVLPVGAGSLGQLMLGKGLGGGVEIQESVARVAQGQREVEVWVVLKVDEANLVAMGVVKDIASEGVAQILVFLVQVSNGV